MNYSTSATRRSTIVDGAAKVAKYKRWIWVEIVALSLLIVVVWCLLSLPVVFFHLPIALVSCRSICLCDLVNADYFTDDDSVCVFPPPLVPAPV